MKLLGNLEKLNQYCDTVRSLEENHCVPSKVRLYADFFWSLARYGSTVSDYFQYRFWEKSGAAKKQFMTARYNNAFYRQINSREGRAWLNHKASFNKNFAPYLKRETIAVPGASLEEFQDFCRRHGRFFVKPCKTGAGEGVRLCRYEEIADYPAYYRELSKGEFVVEQCIIQNETMAGIHPQSINTVRAITFFDGKDVTLIGGVMRCGTGDSYIDNHGGGGLMALVDMETGTIISPASSKWRVGILRHPDTGVIFPGFRIPYWDKAMAMVRETARAVGEKGLHHVGWDIAFLPDDVCLVEANPSGDPVILQEPAQQGVKPVYDWMLRSLQR